MSQIIKEKINKLSSNDDLKEICLFLFDEFEKLLRTFKSVEISFASLNDFVKKINKLDSNLKKELSKILEKLSVIENTINEFWSKDAKSSSTKKNDKKYNEEDLKKFS